MKQNSPELFAQRPVRSDFGRRREPVLNLRRLFLLIGLVGLAVLIGIGVNMMSGGEATPQGEVPTIKAEGPLKERPDQPGGIDVPHQDVTVFQQLETKGGEGGGKASVEHLLPAPETPQPVPVAEKPPETAAPSPLEAAEPEPSPIAAAEPVLLKEPENPMKSAENLIGEAKPAPVKAEAPKKAEPAPVKAEKPAPVKEAQVASSKTIADLVKKTETKPAETAEHARLPKELFTTGEIPSAAKAASSAAEKTAAVSGKTAQAQFASVPNQAEAQSEAKRLQSKLAGILGGASLRVVKADIPGKGIYYRVTTSPLAEAKAKAICAAAAKQKASCLVVR